VFPLRIEAAALSRVYWRHAPARRRRGRVAGVERALRRGL